jgi:integrase
VNLYKRCRCVDKKRCQHPFWFRFRLERQHYRESTRTKKRQLAERLAQKRKLEILERGHGLRRIKPVRFSEHVKAYLKHTEKTNRSSYKDAAVLARLVTSAGDRPITEVSPFQIERWRQQRAAEVSKSTVNRELNIVRGCFSRAVEWGRLSLSPLRNVKAYNVDNVRLRICSAAEIKKLLDGASPDLKLLSCVTLESLLRLSEALSLRREDVGHGFLTILRSKNGRSRRVPITPELRGELLEHCHKSGFVFGRGDKGQPPRAAAVSVAFARLAKELGLPGVSHHTLRHTGATVMVAKGVSLRAVQTIGGWSSLRMVERYAHVDDAELARAVRITHAHTDEATKAVTATEDDSAKKESAGGSK